MEVEKSEKLTSLTERVIAKSYVKTFIKLFKDNLDKLVNELVESSLKEIDLSNQEKEEIRKELITTAYKNIENAIMATVLEFGLKKIKAMKKEDLLQRIVAKLQEWELKEEKDLQKL